MGIGNKWQLSCKLRNGKNLLRDLLHDWGSQEEEQWNGVILGKQGKGYYGLLSYSQGIFAWINITKVSLALRIRKT